MHNTHAPFCIRRSISSDGSEKSTVSLQLLLCGRRRQPKVAIGKCRRKTRRLMLRLHLFMWAIAACQGFVLFQATHRPNLRLSAAKCNASTETSERSSIHVEDVVNQTLAHYRTSFWQLLTTEYKAEVTGIRPHYLVLCFAYHLTIGLCFRRVPPLTNPSS